MIKFAHQYSGLGVNLLALGNISDWRRLRKDRTLRCDNRRLDDFHIDLGSGPFGSSVLTSGCCLLVGKEKRLVGHNGRHGMPFPPQ